MSNIAYYWFNVLILVVSMGGVMYFTSKNKRYTPIPVSAPVPRNACS